MAKKKTEEKEIRHAGDPNVMGLRGAVVEQPITATLDENYMPSILDYGYHKAISISSMSKMYSMAGTRIGWIVCRDHEMYEVMKTRRSYNTICCGIWDEIIASIALEHYQALWARARSILEPNRKIVEDWVASQPHLHLRAKAMGTTCLIDYDYDVDSETLAKDCLLYTSPSPRD